MFIYENGNSLNLTFKGNIPVENPEIVIKGYENGASLTVNDNDVITVADAVEFEGKAKTFVFQKDGKLMITFKGLTGITAPDMTIDEIATDVYEVAANGSTVTLTLTDEEVVVGEQTSAEPTTTKVEPEVPVQEPEVEQTEEPVATNDPEEIEEETEAE